MIDPEVKNIIKLIQRSKDVGDGWRIVSVPLESLVRDKCALSPELFNIDDTDGMKVRLSETGKTIEAYL